MSRPARLAVVLAGIVLLGGAVGLSALALPGEARPAVLWIGSIVGIVLALQLFSGSLGELTAVLAGLGIALAAIALAANVAVLVAVPVLLLAFGELASVRAVVLRAERDSEIDQQGRLAESAVMLAVAAVAASAAALGSIVDVPGQIIAVMLGAAAIAGLGKLIAERARR
jgi:hypothetical protein